MKHTQRKDSVRSTCLLCERIFDKTREHTPQRRFTNYKKTAKNKKRVFKLTFEEFESITNKQCTYCGGYSNTQHGEQFCGIDRINSNKGYVKNNITPCCDTCNYMKSSLTRKEFSDHIKNIFQHINKE
jgi:hypothetical protein